jgi:RNA polymerase sigma-70 factor (ECF subfamily)
MRWICDVSATMSPPAESLTDAELLVAFADDPGAALGMLYDRYGGLVYGLALAILGTPPEAEDVTQEIFLALRGHFDFDPARGTLSAFLVTLTRSRAIDRVRSRKRRTNLVARWLQTAPAAAPVPTPLDHVATAECARRVRAALAALPEQQRRAIEMAYYRGLSQTEIAAEIGAPLGTVKTWVRRGLLELRTALADFVG